MNELQSLVDSIKGLVELDDDVFNDEAMKAIIENVSYIIAKRFKLLKRKTDYSPTVDDTEKE